METAGLLERCHGGTSPQESCNIIGQQLKSIVTSHLLPQWVLDLHLSPDTSPPTIAMARPKGEKGSIQMFQPYKADLVPAVMPFPDLANVVTAKNDETAVPKLNDFQRSWIHDVALRGADLANLTKQDATDLYDSIKRDAFNAAPFKHTPQPGDEAEESRLPGLVAAWKLARKKADASGSAGHAGGAEEDEEGRTGLLRGYTLNGWKIAIQKVLSNKRTAEKNKVAKDAKTQPTAAAPAPAPASAVAKLMGMMQYGGRDKFRDDRHDEIHKYSKTLPGEGNPGGKFRKAEALLWEKEDQAAWAAAAMVEEDVDWELRQKLVASGVKHLVDTVHSSGKFRPFVATMTFCWLDAEGKAQFEWAEAIPSGIVVAQPFTEQFPDQAAEMINKMYIWAEKPLKDFVATREKSAQAPPPVFPLSLAALDDTGHKTLAQAVCDYLVRSYDAAFGTQDIPWGSIATAPGDFYETAGFEANFSSGCWPWDERFLPQATSSYSAAAHCVSPYSTSSYSAAVHSVSPYSTCSYSAAVHSVSPYSTCSYSAAVHSAAVHSTSSYSAAVHSAAVHSASAHSTCSYCACSYSASAHSVSPPDTAPAHAASQSRACASQSPSASWEAESCKTDCSPGAGGSPCNKGSGSGSVRACSLNQKYGEASGRGPVEWTRKASQEVSRRSLSIYELKL
ncbi:hypothetical protein C8R47DRAFT_1258839 [Mycena vitilis]|nr:hypothetical protein C8R47DRAFT_1258839 [Mycena vitilis]